MKEESLKTSVKQRIFIAIIAAILLGSSLAMYIGIVLSKNSSEESAAQVNQALISELNEKIESKQKEFEEAAKVYSDKYYETLNKYRSEIRSYNSADINEKQEVETQDLVEGDGAEISSTDDNNYFAYYVGWCADESVFDSSFDNFENPTSLKAPLDPEIGLIEGWKKGVSGMKLGGVRELSIPGPLAYGESQEICGGKNSPLKFIILPFERNEKLNTISEELTELQLRLQYAYYGLDYDKALEEATAEVKNEESGSDE